MTDAGVKRILVADTSTLLGRFKPLQSTNYVLSADFGSSPEEIEQKKARIATHWTETETKMVLVYHHSDIFKGYGKTGLAGDASLVENYDFRQLDREIGRVVQAGAVACLQFEDCLSTYLDHATPQLFEKMGFVLANRYGNGHGFSDSNALAMIEIYPEPDMYTTQLRREFYVPYFERIAAFARGARSASAFVGIGACGANRMYFNPESMPESPFHYEFYRYVKEHNVPIKAVTFHWVTPFSQNPMDLIASARSVREQLNKAGLQNMPIWITEYNRNPAPILPKHPEAIAEYKSLSQAASFMLSAQLIAQDADVEQCLPWTGLGYGFYGAGNAWFEAYYESPTDAQSPDTINPMGAAWYLHGKFLQNTPIRVQFSGTEGCFAGLAGMSEDQRTVQILLSNYQYSDHLLLDLNKSYYGAMDDASKEWMCLGADGRLHGEYLTFKPPAPPGLSMSGPQPQFCTNRTIAYDLKIPSLPWDAAAKYECTIFRVDDKHSLRKFRDWSATGPLRIEQDFPRGSMDLLVIKLKPQ